MHLLLSRWRPGPRPNHRAVFGAFARSLARVIGRTGVRARIRAVESQSDQHRSYAVIPRLDRRTPCRAPPFGSQRCP